MCGITGWIDWKRDLRKQVAILETMNQTHCHRGPDAEGKWVSRHAALGHRRLAVIDPKGGAQPMVRRSGERSYVIVYNGELYNMDELRRELEQCGHRMESRSDTELVLRAYMQWGPACMSRLRGIFAYAIWDEAEKRLFLARDRIGVKPLFYAVRDGAFLFGSELKSLLAHPDVEPVIDAEGLAEVLVMSPARTPGHGVFRGVEELRPGWWMIVDRDGIRKRPYWTLESREHTDDLPTTIERVRSLFQDTVRRQLVSDVPVGTMLSGGLDSSAISAWASRVMEEEGAGPVDTFSVDYVGNDRHFTPNEFQPNADAPWVKRMSEYLGSRHHVIEVDLPELIKALTDAVRARDLPGMTDVDASLLLFCKEIKQTATMVLSGECADEVFGGYPWFHRREMVEADTFPWARMTDQRVRFLSREVTRITHPDEYVQERYREAIAEVPALDGEEGSNARMREMFYLNLTRWMPTLLDRKDRMSMAVGLEVRVPFCDHPLVEYMWNVPWEWKALEGREKGLLRRALTGILPDDVLWRKKSPYPKTHDPGYLTAVVDQVLQLLDDPQSPLRDLLDIEAVRSFARSDLSKVHLPWFGQLMNVPQLFAHWWQLDMWMREYGVSIKV